MASPTPNTFATDPTPSPRLRRLCLLTLFATFVLIAIGGKVTSYEYGLAIPEGWTTGGWVSFLAPLEHWWHDIDKRWEHTHRIMGTVVGMLTVAMAAGLLFAFRDPSRDADPQRRGKLLATLYKLRISREGERPWLRIAGVIMLVLVCIQGAMGALRVSEVSITLAFIHGIVGQLILCSWVVVAAALSKPWLSRLMRMKTSERGNATPRLRWAVRLLLVALLAQLTLGAAVRHFKADKTPPDMLVYGQVVPPMSQEALDEAVVNYYADRMGVSPEDSGVSNRNPFGDVVASVGDVHLQLAHRLGALIVSAMIIAVIIWAYRKAGDSAMIVAPSLVLLMLLGTQVALGVMTVLSETDPILATLHQATGAALIACATWLAVRIHLVEYTQPAAIADKNPKQAAEPRPAAAPTALTA
jgi:cytochrome c oxidase assembly protein subunit 15